MIWKHIFLIISALVAVNSLNSSTFLQLSDPSLLNDSSNTPQSILDIETSALIRNPSLIQVSMSDDDITVFPVDPAEIVRAGDLTTSTGVEAVINALKEIDKVQPTFINGVSIEDQDDLNDFIKELTKTYKKLLAEENLSNAEALADSSYPPIGASSAETSVYLSSLISLQSSLSTLQDFEPLAIATVRNILFDSDSLKNTISELKERIKILTHLEELDSITDSAIFALGNATTSSQYFSYADTLEQLLPLLSAEEKIILNNIPLTKSQVQDLIDSSNKQGKFLLRQETIHTAALDIEELKRNSSDPNQNNKLRQSYVDLANLFKECNEERVEIDGVEMNKCDLQNAVKELDKENEEVEREEQVRVLAERVNEIIQDYSKQTNSKVPVVIEYKDFEKERKVKKELEITMNETDEVEIDSIIMNKEEVEESIEGLDETIERLKDNNLAKVIKNGVVSYEDKDFAKREKKNAEDAVSAEDIIKKGELSDEDKNQLFKILKKLEERMENTDTVEIDSVIYNKKRLEGYISKNS